MKEQNKLKDMNSPCIRETCLHGCSPFLGPPPDAPPTSAASFRFDFAVSATSSLNPNPAFTNHESLPSLHESLSNFTRAFPQFLETGQADLIRDREYHHLSSAEHVCLDYSIGHGLFSYSQQCILNSIPSSSSHPAVSCSGTTFFEISYRPVSLTAQLTRGGLESEVESMTRKRITRFMNLSEEDYVMVFASNQSSAFRIVADSYPFRSCGNLLTVYDHESEAVDSMIKVSRKRGAKVRSAEFSWPNLRIRSAKLRNMLVGNEEASVQFKRILLLPARVGQSLL